MRVDLRAKESEFGYQLFTLQIFSNFFVQEPIYSKFKRSTEKDKEESGEYSADIIALKGNLTLSAY